MIKAAIFCLSFLFCLALSAGTIDPNTPDSKYLEYGADFNCVVKINGKYKDNSFYEGSAVLIDDHNFLTAAHVISNYETCNIILNKEKYSIIKVIPHPDFKDDTPGFADIAIGHSEKKFSLEFYPSLYIHSDEPGKVCSISGYGYTGNFNSGANIHDGKKRAGSNFIDKIDRDLLICTPSYRTDKNYTELEFLIASGDSGGPLFIEQKVAGINSLLMAVKKKTESKYNEESGHTRVSKFIHWINLNKLKN